MRPRGFTLIETMLTVALTVIAVLLATAIFVNLQRANSIAERYDRLLGDARTAMDTIALAIRSSTVDYAAYRNPAVDLGDPVGRLRLVSVTGLRTVFLLGSDGVAYECTVDSAIGEPGTKCDGTPPGSEWIPITSTDSTVTDLTFVLVPGSDPFTASVRSSGECATTGQFNPTFGACTCAADADCLADQRCTATIPTTKICRLDPNADSLQPRVTVLLNGRTKQGQVLRSPIETTVTTRVYRR